MKTLGVITFGCRLNSLESESIISAFKKEGWAVDEGSDSDDAVIINTCTVTSKADQGARRIIRKYGSRVPTIVTGCYATLSQKQDIESLGTHVRLIKDKSVLLESDFILSLANNTLSDISKHKYNPFVFSPDMFTLHSRASLKIQDGCDNSCSFCAVHLARGKSISLSPNEILSRIKQLEDNGYKEICLTGVNLSSYRYDDISFSNLLERIIPNLSSDTRLRFSSLEPDYLDDAFLSLASDFHIFPFFHLPIQSAAKRVLELTGRKYDKNDVAVIIEKLRKAKHNPYIAADFIAGLPGEGDDEFKETYDFIKDTKLSKLHVFPYSPRSGTTAAKAHRVPERIRDERAKSLQNLSNDLYNDYILSCNNAVLEAICEKQIKEGIAVTTGNYIKAIIKHPTGLFKEGDLIRGTLQIENDLTVFVPCA